ncbi:fasciclin domain-containing protein, partial [Larkinella harenae]
MTSVRSSIRSFYHRNLAVLLVASSMLVTLASCNKDDDDNNPPAPQTITDIVLSNNDFSLLEAAVVRAGLADALRSGTLTVFAPTNAAFQAAGFANEAAI